MALSVREIGENNEFLAEANSLYERLWSFGEHGQLSLQYNLNLPYEDRFKASCGSFSRKGLPYSDEDFNTVVPECESLATYFEWVGSVLEGRVVRARIMTLEPKACLSYHQDDVKMRCHLVMKTNRGAMFVVDGNVYQMKRPGHLYTIDTGVLHTALNAHYSEQRIHLVMSVVPWPSR